MFRTDSIGSLYPLPMAPGYRVEAFLVIQPVEMDFESTDNSVTKPRFTMRSLRWFYFLVKKIWVLKVFVF
jgi:hypothetical protein